MLNKEVKHKSNYLSFHINMLENESILNQKKLQISSKKKGTSIFFLRRERKIIEHYDNINEMVIFHLFVSSLISFFSVV